MARIRYNQAAGLRDLRLAAVLARFMGNGKKAVLLSKKQTSFRRTRRMYDAETRQCHLQLFSVPRARASVTALSWRQPRGLIQAPRGRNDSKWNSLSDFAARPRDYAFAHIGRISSRVSL